MGCCCDIKIGDYVVLGMIGKGKQANVILVKDPKTNREYALKRYIRCGSQERDGIQQVENLRRLKSQYIVEIKDHFVDKNSKHFNIILEKCQCSLEKVLNSLSDPRRIEYQKQIIKGVSYLHSENMIHRDLKLQNILIKNRKIKISDFGLSKKLYSKLNTEVPYGEEAYSSPQYLAKGYYSRAADCWALGLILLQIQTKTRARKFREQSNTPAKVQNFPNEMDLKQVKSSATMKQIIKGLLQRDDKNRLTAKKAEQLINQQN